MHRGLNSQACHQMQKEFWDAPQNSYSDERDEQGNIDHYHGQNANIHTEHCLALIRPSKIIRIDKEPMRLPKKLPAI